MQLKNTSGAAQWLPSLGVNVADGETVEATGDDAKNLIASGSFERVDSKPSKSEKE